MTQECMPGLDCTIWKWRLFNWTTESFTQICQVCRDLNTIFRECVAKWEHVGSYNGIMRVWISLCIFFYYRCCLYCTVVYHVLCIFNSHIRLPHQNLTITINHRSPACMPSMGYLTPLLTRVQCIQILARYIHNHMMPTDHKSLITAGTWQMVV